MLDMKLFDQGQFSSRKERFFPADVFTFILNVFAQQSEISGSKIVFEEIGSSKLPALLVGDQIHLKQVLVNLTKNALKFSQGKEIKIRA